MKYWKVPREWEGQTAFIIGGGPSVLKEDIPSLEGRNVLVINSSYAIAPFAQYLFAMDTRWLRQHAKRLSSFQGQVVTVSTTFKLEGLKRLRKLPPPGISLKRDAIVGRRTSLHSGINLCVHLGARRIVLIGADCREIKGRTHHHEPHQWPQKPDCWDEQYRDLKGTAKPLRRLGIEVINTSLKSRLDFWPKVPLQEVLNERLQQA